LPVDGTANGSPLELSSSTRKALLIKLEPKVSLRRLLKNDGMKNCESFCGPPPEGSVKKSSGEAASQVPKNISDFSFKGFSTVS
jgi:hypothetical protein